MHAILRGRLKMQPVPIKCRTVKTTNQIAAQENTTPGKGELECLGLVSAKTVADRSEKLQS